MEAWHDFLVAQVGASAALGGLLFVGLSLNLEKILGFPGVPERAQITLVMILATLLLGSLLLIPRQEFFPLGIEGLAVGIVTVALGTQFGLRSIRATQPAFRPTVARNLLLFEVATIPYIIGGALLFRGNDSGMYWIAAAICISLVKAMLDAWVLLVEINR
jgi:modulator of FtsH protease